MTETSSCLTPSTASFRAPHFTSPGWRFALLVLLTIVMLVPLTMISLVIEDRVSYRRSAIYEVSSQWGGEIAIAGPVLVLPVEKAVERKVTGPDGSWRTETETVSANAITIMPDQYTVTANAASEVRRRGVFDVPVFTSDIAMEFDFDTSQAESKLSSRESILWDRAYLAILMPEARNFSDHAVLKQGQKPVRLEPGTRLSGIGGIHSEIGDPRGSAPFLLKMALNGAGALRFSPAGRQTDVVMTSDWAHPSFTGNFLPKTREVSAEGFSASWAIPHLARNIPQMSRELSMIGPEFGVRFYQPVDLYQKAQRAVKYGILFVALTFLTVFLTERASRRPVHPAQFLLIGVAQSIFFLVLLGLAEQLGFQIAYVVASAATIGLLSFYGATALGLGRRCWILGGSLVVLYATLFLILRSTDFALLAGSILAFIAVTVVMIMTRGMNWSAPDPSGNDVAPA